MAAIMLVSTASSIGGMERVVCSLARGLTARGADVRTFFPESEHADQLLAWCAEQGVAAETHAAVVDAAAPHGPGTARALRRLIADVDPDLVNVHYGDNFLSMWDLVGSRAAGPRRPIVVSIHHPTEWTGASWRKRVMTGTGSWGASAVTTFAGATRDVLRRAGVPARRLHVIPCGVRVPAHQVARLDARELRDLADDTFVVGTLARLVEYKGIDRLIAAMDCPDLGGSVLLVGGDGPYRADLERMAQDAPHVDARFLGRLEDVGELFAASDVFALPSRLEGFGLVYVEAAMYGVPSVATNVGGIPEAVLDGRTGRLVDPEDSDAVRAALIELRSDPEGRRRMGEAARRRAHEELDEETMVSRYVDLFMRVADRRRPIRVADSGGRPYDPVHGS